MDNELELLLERDDHVVQVVYLVLFDLQLDLHCGLGVLQFCHPLQPLNLEFVFNSLILPSQSSIHLFESENFLVLYCQIGFVSLVFLEIQLQYLIKS